MIKLRCSSWHSFADTYVDDLARGALCVAHTHALPLLSIATIRLSLPDSINIELRARVVQVFTGEQGEQSEPTVALELLEMDSEHKQQLAQLVEFARALRDGDSEHESFTRVLLDRAHSIPPRELGMRLSLLPSRASLPARTSQAAATLGSDSGESGYRNSVAPRSRGDEITRPLTPTDARDQAAADGNGGASTEAVARPPDPFKLKALLSNVAHKHYDAALRIANELLEANSQDPQAQRWRALCHARIALTRNDTRLAAQAYAKVLELDPSDREAREYIKYHKRAKKLESLPFGRYFAKRK